MLGILLVFTIHILWSTSYFLGFVVSVGGESREVMQFLTTVSCLCCSSVCKALAHFLSQ